MEILNYDTLRDHCLNFVVAHDALGHKSTVDASLENLRNQSLNGILDVLSINHGQSERIIRTGVFGIELIPPSFCTLYKGEETIGLTKQETKLLAYFASFPGRPLPSDNILMNVWGSEYIDDTNYLRVYISRLRMVLKKHDPNREYIETLHGLGYRFHILETVDPLMAELADAEGLNPSVERRAGSSPAEGTTPIEEHEDGLVQAAQPS